MNTLDMKVEILYVLGFEVAEVTLEFSSFVMIVDVLDKTLDILVAQLTLLHQLLSLLLRQVAPDVVDVGLDVLDHGATVGALDLLRLRLVDCSDVILQIILADLTPTDLTLHLGVVFGTRDSQVLLQIQS